MPGTSSNGFSGSFLDEFRLRNPSGLSLPLAGLLLFFQSNFG